MTRKNYLILAMIISHLIIGEIGMCKKIKIDADNHRICGKSNMRQWQHHQSAYKCNDDDDDWLDLFDWRSTDAKVRSKRVAGGADSYEGEFPSAVILRGKHTTNGKTRVCGGTLIHSNLVITAAICLANVDKLEVQLGTANPSISKGITIEADNWCQHKKYSGGHGYNIAIVRLSQKVDYIYGKIWPACLRLSDEHKSSATCSAVGFGLESEQDLANRLKTIELKRNCYTSSGVKHSMTCYSTDDQPGGVCSADQGSGLYCFGKVNPCDSDTKRSFVVGSFGWTDSDCNGNKKTTQYFADFYKNRRAIRDMINTLIHAGKVKEDHTCKRW
uniref:Coagulation factor X n=1 Tax=Aceria tosichella TaxID=561515 RepID=A0A6G1SJE0_9ACAR